MSLKTFFILLTTACVITTASTQNYDYYAFALEWPSSVCQFKNCMEDHTKEDTWNLHGLWPNSINGHHTFFCTKSPTDWDQLPSSLVSELDLYWSGLYSSMKKFMDHEWTKHGTCWRTDYGDLEKMPEASSTILKRVRNDSEQKSSDFFEFVVSLSKEVYNIYDILKESNIIPDQSKTYSLEDINSSLQQGFGQGSVTQFQVNCQ